MKTWFKLESKLLSDTRIKRLVSEKRTGGFGAYCMIRIIVETIDDCTLDILWNMLSAEISRKMITEIVNDYGLFSTDDDGHIHVYACTRALTPALTPALTDVPLDKEENRIEEKENKESEGATAFSSLEKEDRASAADDNPLEAMVQKLAHDQIWREALLLTHPAERAMLENDFAWCVRYALQCSLSEGREQRLYYPYMAKKFFNAFLGQPECVNRLRNAFICHEQPMEDRLTFDRLTQYYPRIMALPEPLTKAQLDSLIERWGTDQIVFTMRQLNNYANIDRYHGAMEAIESWARKMKN